MVRPDCRVYGTVEGLAREAAEALGHEAGFDDVSYEEGLLTVEYEGRYLDAEGFAWAVAAALPGDGSGQVDLIDNEAWTVTRFVVGPGKVDAETYGIDDVLEYVKNEGNF